MTAENGAPVQYGVQILVNADSPSAHWKFDEDYPLHDNAEDAQADLAEALDYGYADEHTRVVAVSVLPPAERATGAIVPERQRCICNDWLCRDNCRACNHSGRDLEEPCIADPDWTPDDEYLAIREGRVIPPGVSR